MCYPGATVLMQEAMQEIARPRWPLLGVRYMAESGVGSGFVGDEGSSPLSARLA